MRFVKSLLSTVLVLAPISVMASPYHQAGMQARLVSANETCAGLATSMASSNVSIISTTVVTAGTVLQPAHDQGLVDCYYATWNATVDMCRLIANISTTERSFVTAEVWLPTGNETEGPHMAWNGRFIATGNGGAGGCIGYADLKYTTSFGFAALGDNGGHDGYVAEQFLNNNDVVLDYSWRARYVSTPFGKAVTSTFYGRDPSYSYYIGCSGGGRQGLKAIQEYPDYFDGVIAGAPAVDFNHLVDYGSHLFRLTGANTSEGFITYDQWVAISEEILVQCDLIDGVADGVLEDPLLCHFDPATLICGTGNSTVVNSTTCLTQMQADTVTKIYEPVYDEGKLIFPGLPLSSELVTYSFWLNGVVQPLADSWFKYAIYNDPDFDTATISPKDWEYADSVDPRNGFVSTWSADLSTFRDQGRKLIAYHGTIDGTISGYNSLRYYERVSSTMNAGPAELDDFFRLFRISGLGHCNFGTGADAFGQNEGALASANGTNILLALVDWVEEGIAPEVITGTRYENDDITEPVEYLRNHCRYPYRTTYIGGNPNLTTSWDCQWIDDWKSFFPEEDF